MCTESKISVTVDCVVFGFDGRKLNLLLTSDMQSGSEKLQLLSGFMKPAESVDDTALRIIREAIGFDNIQPEQIYAFSRLDYREVAISIAYYAVIPTEAIFRTSDSEKLKWLSRKELMNIQDKSNQIIECAFQKLQQKAFSEIIGLGFLPKKFTWNQLHKLYEALAEKSIDKRNFQKKINSLKIVRRLGEKEKLGSKKGSFLYSYNKEYQSEYRLKFV